MLSVTSVLPFRAVTELHLTVSQAAKKFKRSRRWVYTLLKRYESGGEDAVYHNQLPKTSPTKVPEATVKHIVAIRRELTAKGADNGPETIRWALAQRDLYAPSESITRRILTQQGFIFTARLAGARGGKNGFEKFLEDNSIKQKNGRPSHPQTQGKIESFHQTLKKWLKARPPAQTLPEQQRLLDEFRHWYNHERPHRALGRDTPHHAYTALPKQVHNHS